MQISGYRFSDARRSARLIGHVAGFEIARQLRQPIVWIAVAVFFGFALLSISTEGFLGSPVLARNAPGELAKAVGVLTVFYVFVVVALAGDAALRDASSGFESILRAAPISRFENLLGRYLGLQAVSVGAFLTAMLGLVAGSVMPWTDAATIGAWNWPQVGLIALVLAAPTVVFTSGGCFAIAAALRSTTAAYVTVILALLSIFLLPALLERVGGDLIQGVAVVEPFGIAALIGDARFIDPAVRGRVAFPWDGLLIINRLVGLGLAVLVIGAAFLFERRADETRLGRPSSAEAEAPAPRPLRPVSRRFGLGAGVAQFLVRLKLEVGSLLRSPSLLILTVLVLVITVVNLWSANSLAGTPSLPVTRVMAEELRTPLILVGLLIAGFYAADITRRERDRRVADLIDTTPVSNLLLMAPKLIAVIVVLLLVSAAAIAGAVGVQLAKGYPDAEPGQYLALVVAPVGLQMTFLVAFGLAVGALAPNRFAAGALVALLLAFSFTAQAMGFGHPLFDPLSTPLPELSEMNPGGDGSHAFLWISLYWCLWGAVLLFLTWLFWPRGHRASFRAVLARARRRLKGGTALTAAALGVATAGLGGFIFLNLNVWTEFHTERQIEALQASYERALTPFENAPEPSIVDVRLTVEIEPRRSRLRAAGAYVIENRTDRPLTQMHVQMPGDMDWTLDVEGARQTRLYEDYEFCVLTFDTPMQPGERRRLTFTSAFAPHGFGDAQTSVVRNGTFVRNDDFAPVIGVTGRGFLTDRDARRRQGLTPERAMRDPTAPGARDHNYLRADPATLDITVVTDADQTPIAPGRRISDTVTGDRRTARFVTKAPVLTFYSVQSARYAVRTVRHAGIDVSIYFHPGHDRNVDRMMRALTGGLDIYREAFGPYPLDYLRIVEFPAYGDYAQAFPGTIPYSENAGFITDVRDPKNFDYVTSITLHELAHQWWGHQMVGADAKGALLLSEGLAEYSSVMAQARLQGYEMANRSMGLAWTSYRKGRAERREPEPPLYRVERQTYIGYGRSQLALNWTRTRIGEAALHRALRGLLAEYGGRGAPYPVSDDLLAAIRAETPPKRWPKVERAFTQIPGGTSTFFTDENAPTIVTGNRREPAPKTGGAGT